MDASEKAAKEFAETWGLETGSKEKTMSNQETGKQWMERLGIKVGDRVRVIRTDWAWYRWDDELHEPGNYHESALGKTGVIEEVDNSGDIWLVMEEELCDGTKDCDFRPCSLEPVEEVVDCKKATVGCWPCYYKDMELIELKAKLASERVSLERAKRDTVSEIDMILKKFVSG